MTSFLPPASAVAALAGLNPNAVSSADLYARVSKSLLAQNPSIAKLNKSIIQDQAHLSGLGQLHSALANFRAFAQSLGGAGLETAATPSNPAVLAALTSGSAKPASYAIEVKQLAQGQVLTSSAQKAQDVAIGAGGSTTIKVELGTQSGSGSFSPSASSASVKTITIDSSNNTLQGIAAAFNAAGIDAKIVHTGSTYALALNGQTGAANSLRVSVGGDGALQTLLSYNRTGIKGLSETAKAQDAVLTVDGKTVSSASNVVTSVIGGTALALRAKGSTTVSIAQNPDQIATNIGNFVTAYNDLNNKVANLRSGPLNADAGAGQALDQLRQILASGGDTTLATIGVTQGASGALQIDSKKLAGAIAQDPGAVVKLFTGEGKGITDQLAGKIGELLGPSATLSRQEGSVGRDITALSQKKDKLSQALSTQANALVAQYSQASQSTPNTALPGLPGGGATSLFDFLA
jgi:flagellar hook-associated protein 2